MKNRNQMIVLGALLLVAMLVWYFNFHGATGGAGNKEISLNAPLLSVENPSLHLEKIPAAQRTEYKSLGRNPFSVIAPPPPEAAKAQVRQAHVTVGPMPLPPPAPPVLPANLKFFGYGTVPKGTSKRAFFTDGEDVFIVAEGESLLGRYRVVKINNSNLEFVEISSGLHNTVALVADESGSTVAPS